jgi:putative flavoprotein involved in K+ transport
VLDVANVIWCTGFGKDVSWIDIPVAGEDGWPEQTRGVVESSPGLYFVGLPFLYAFASMLIGGVGRDAERVAEHIAAREPATAAEAAVSLWGSSSKSTNTATLGSSQ